MDAGRTVAFSLAAVGLGISIYLTAEVLYPSQVPLRCPTTGILNCGQVAFSPYSHILGVPVALLGAIWFALMLILFTINAVDFTLPLWSIGVAFVGYLVWTEVVLIRSICPYCTVAHACAIALGYPVIRAWLGGGE
jgi:uncharacterized membrane protein